MANINDNEESGISQCKMILAWLESGRTLTQLQATNLFGCIRLPSRVNDLRNRGFNIEMTKVRTNTGKWIGEYKLKKSSTN